MFRKGVLVGIAHGIAQQQVPFTKRVDILSLDGGVRVACLPNTPVIQVLEIIRPVEIEEVRAGVLPVPLCHFEFQRQKVRHHDFRATCSKFAEHDVVMPPEFVGVVLHVFPVTSVEPACRPQDFVRNFGRGRRMFVLKIAHAHAARNAFCDAVFEQLDVRDFSCFSKEVLYLALGCSKFLVRSEAPQMLSDDVVVPEAHVNRTVFFGNELQELHIGEVIVCDIARDAAGVCRQEVAFEEDFEMFAQNGDSAGYRRIEIDMQIADKVVSHASNLYLGIWGVKGTNCELDFPKFQ